MIGRSQLPTDSVLAIYRYRISSIFVNTKKAMNGDLVPPLVRTRRIATHKEKKHWGPKWRKMTSSCSNYLLEMAVEVALWLQKLPRVGPYGSNEPAL